MGGVFAVSTVLPEKIQRLAADHKEIRQFVHVNALGHALQTLGRLVLSGLTRGSSMVLLKNCKTLCLNQEISRKSHFG